jgi:hypothetical protein
VKKWGSPNARCRGSPVCDPAILGIFIEASRRHSNGLVRSEATKSRNSFERRHGEDPDHGENHQEYEEQDLGDIFGASRDPTETQQSRDRSQHEEKDRPLE